jgi:hypothetical protein
VRNKVLKIIVLTIILFTAYGINAQEIEPRNYSCLPTGVNAVVAAYSISDGNVVSDASSPIQGLSLTSHSLSAGYVRTFGFFNKLARVQVSMPYVYLSGNAKLNGRDTSASRSGLADLRVRFEVNIFGTPALAPKEFQRFKEETVLGASIVVSMPTGQYYNEKLINIGSNRWGFKPEIGFSHRYKSIFFETFAGVWFFTSNNEYLKTNILKQDPLFVFQCHIDYLFPSGIWIALNGGFANGGATLMNEYYRDDLQNNIRIGGTFSAPLGKNHSIKVVAHTAALTKAGGSYSILSLAYQYVWL